MLLRVALLLASVWLAGAAALHAQEKPLADELPRLPPVEPRDALATFHLERGFTLELVASEPLVGDPVDASFDENGRMFVAEFHAYPFAKEKEKIIPAGTERTESGLIRMLEDVDGDGVFEKSTIFADKLDWPLSVACYQGGVFVIDPPDVYYLKDTDGDGRADVRETIFSHLGRNNVQGLANNLKWGLDNRIWVASGSNGGAIFHRGEKVLNLGRSDWTFDPRTQAVSRASGGVQFGHSMNDWGDRFLCSNSNHILHVVFEEKYLARNPYVAVPSPVRGIAKEGGAAPVFRRSPIEPWRIVRTRRRAADPKYQHLPDTEKVPAGFFTSAAGVTIYRGSAYPEEYRGNAFVGDVGSNLVHRKTLAERNATYEAVRADAGVEFIASTDTWFRPVNYVNAPDGTLFVLDMYRETIEHPISIPEDIKAHLDLESGNDRGRIYRLVSPQMKRERPPRLGDASLSELVAHLASPNSWNRETAQRLLWERQDPAAIPLIVALFQSTPSPQGRLHSLYTLEGLNGLRPDLLAVALRDPHPGVRRHAVQLAEPFLAMEQTLIERVIALADDPEFRPRFQAALAVGYMQGDAAQRALETFAMRLGTDADLQAAFLLAVGDRGVPLAASLLQNDQFLQQKTASSLLVRIAELVGARPEHAEAAKLLTALSAPNVSAELQATLLPSLGAGLARRGTSLAKLIAAEPADSPARSRMRAMFARAVQVAADEDSTPAEQERAVRLLAFAPWETSADSFATLLSPQAPQSVQAAAITALETVDDPGVGALLIRVWPGLTPALRGKTTDVLLSRPERTALLLDAIEAGAIKSSEIDRAKHPQLLKHPQEKVRERAGKLLAGETKGDRRKVLEQYQSSLELVGNIEQGRQTFTQKCAACHKLGDVGYQVGPDLTSVQNKIPADLLTAILDPNREVPQNYVTYTASTLNGQVYFGIIAAESSGSLTLRRGAGVKDDVVLRNQIDELIASGQSLMPEGLEKEINPQQMADLIAFIKSLKGPSAP